MNTQDYNKYLMDEFIQSNNDSKCSTFKALKYDCDNILEFLSFKEKSILILVEQAETNKFIEWLKTFKQYSERTIKKRMCTVRALLRFCQSKGLISDDKKILISEDLSINRINTVSDESLHKLYLYCSESQETDDFFTVRGKLAVLLVLLCGFKVSELCGLKMSDLSEIKKDEINSLCLSDCRIKFIDHEIIADVLNKYLEQREERLQKITICCEQLFISKNICKERLFICSDALSNDFEKIKKICGIDEDIDFSALRNTCIKYYYEKIPDKLIISKIFNITNSRIYKLIQKT